jgi:hypothetical protein
MDCKIFLFRKRLPIYICIDTEALMGSASFTFTSIYDIFHFNTISL